MARSRSALDAIQPPNKRVPHRADHHRLAGWRFLPVILGLVILAGWWLTPALHIAWQLAPFWHPGRYLILLENDAELRPAGGFIGTYAVVTIRQSGWFSTAVQTNIYKIDNPFTTTHSIDPPVPLQAVTKQWALRDSNWSIDFADAAQTVAEFYQQETGQTVDGVVGVTAQAGQALVQLLGSVPLSDGTRLTRDNFYETLDYQVEKGYFVDPANRQANEPKIVIAQLIRTVALRVLAPWRLDQTAHWFETMVATKQIVAASFRPDLQSIIEARGWGDRVDSQSQQYLSVNNANLGGMKSSIHMTQAIDLHISSQPGERATYQLSVTRTHHGTGQWPDHDNTNFTRVVVPANATLTAAAIDSKPVTPLTAETVSGRSVFGFWLTTPVGATTVFTLTLTVPIDQTLRPAFTWQKQPGVVADLVRVAYQDTPLIHGTVDRDLTVPLVK